MAKFEIKFTQADYNEEVRYQYNEKGTRYPKASYNKSTKMTQDWWNNNDEENRTAYYEGF